MPPTFGTLAGFASRLLLENVFQFALFVLDSALRLIRVFLRFYSLVTGYGAGGLFGPRP